MICKQELADKIKKDMSEKFDVKHWIFFFRPDGMLEFYENNPLLNWVYNWGFYNYDEDIDTIANRLKLYFQNLNKQ